MTRKIVLITSVREIFADVIEVIGRMGSTISGSHGVNELFQGHTMCM